MFAFRGLHHPYIPDSAVLLLLAYALEACLSFGPVKHQFDLFSISEFWEHVQLEGDCNDFSCIVYVPLDVVSL